MTRSRRFESLDEWLGWLATLHPKKIDMSLDRVQGVLAALDIATPPYRVITVAGTNGKGSCIALLESIYRAAGYAVGAFTSPHLVRFNERIRFDGQDLDDSALVDLFASIDAARGDLTLSYFEASAVAAMLHFARVGADLGLLEVGMGGRLDAVNAIDADAALIASISLDHMEWLGPDRNAIGREKAGIVRPGCPVVVADADPPTGLIDEIRRRRGDAAIIGRDFSLDPSDGGFLFRRGDEPVRFFPRPAFGGRVQFVNAAAAVAIVDEIRALLPVTDDAIATGISTAGLKGRFERAVVDSSEWVFDVAHNPASAMLFYESLQGLEPVPRTVAVFGAMADKDLDAVVEPFVPLVDCWFVGGIDSDRGATPQTIASLLGRCGSPEVSIHDEISDAARAARSSGADRILVFGSFYAVGPAMSAVGIY